MAKIFGVQGTTTNIQLLARQFDLFNSRMEQIAGVLPQQVPENTYYPNAMIDTDRTHRGGGIFRVNVFLANPAAAEKPFQFWRVDMKMWLEKGFNLPDGVQVGTIEGAIAEDTNLQPPSCPDTGVHFGVGVADPFPIIDFSIGVGTTVPLFDDSDIGFGQSPDKGHAHRWWNMPCGSPVPWRLQPGDSFGTHFDVDWDVDGVHMVRVKISIDSFDVILIPPDVTLYRHKLYVDDFIMPIRVDDSTPRG